MCLAIILEETSMFADNSTVVIRKEVVQIWKMLH